MNSSLGTVLKIVLAQAKVERRLICGLHPAIEILSQFSENVLMCVVSESGPGDSTTHMQTVLLQAYCYENSIPVIKVDNPERLAKLCSGTEKTSMQCVIVTKDLDDIHKFNLSPSERTLIEFYHSTLENFPAPIIQLPG